MTDEKKVLGPAEVLGMLYGMDVEVHSIGGHQNATCAICKKEMKKGNGCTTTREKMGDSSIMNRIPYNGETGKYCGDCNAGIGQQHHPNCDLEECPSCHGQALGCECYFTPEELAELEERQ